MERIYTQGRTKNGVGIGKEVIAEKGPKKETLDFIQRFARICCAEPELSPDLRVIILN